MRHCDLIVYGNNDEIRRRGRKHTRTNVCHVWYTLGKSLQHNNNPLRKCGVPVVGGARGRDSGTRRLESPPMNDPLSGCQWGRREIEKGTHLAPTAPLAAGSCPQLMPRQNSSPPSPRKFDFNRLSIPLHYTRSRCAQHNYKYATATALLLPCPCWHRQMKVPECA